MVDVVANFATPVSNAHLERQARVLAGVYVSSLGKAIAKLPRDCGRGSDLADQIAEAVNKLPQGGAKLWAPELGVARTSALRGKVDAASLQMAILLAQHADAGQWEASLVGPHEVFFDGMRLMLNGPTTVSSRPDEVTIGTLVGARAGEVTLARALDGIWRVKDVHGPSFTLDMRTHLTGSGSADKFVFPAVPRLETMGDEAIERTRLIDTMDASAATPAAAAQALSEAYELVDHVLPDFTSYTRLLIRGFAAIPLQRVEDCRWSSGSGTDHPGVISFTHPANVEWYGETLVHEASHQYLQLLSYNLPVCKPDDGKRYYSSIKGTHRNLERQIIGFHAVANIVLYRRALILKLGRTSGRVADLERFEAYAADMRAELDGATTYTDEGAAFVAELNRKLDETADRVKAA